MWLRRMATIAVAIVLSVSLVNINRSVEATVPGINQLVSSTSSGAYANNSSNAVHLSANGKVVIFDSLATNILPTGGAGIFSRNLAAGATTRVNVSTGGVVDNGGNSTSTEKVSATGRYVLFRSYASNLIDGVITPTSSPQLYLRDTNSSTTVLVTKNSNGEISNGSYVLGVGVSSDGRFIAFTSNASNLHPDSQNGDSHLYMLDRTENSLAILDRNTNGVVGFSAHNPVGEMSCDGSLITFQYGSNLIVSDTPSNHVDIYLLDRRGPVTKLTNLTKHANAAATNPTMSCNGDFIGFASKASNLDTTIPTTTGYNRPYVFDRVKGDYHFAAVTPSNTAATSAICDTAGGTSCIKLSDTGLGVFQANDVSLAGVSQKQVYMRDIYAGTTELVTKSSGGVAANGSYNGNFPSISASGVITAYSSDATNLVSGDTKMWQDVFTSRTGY